MGSLTVRSLDQTGVPVPSLINAMPHCSQVFAWSGDEAPHFEH